MNVIGPSNGLMRSMRDVSITDSPITFLHHLRPTIINLRPFTAVIRSSQSQKRALHKSKGFLGLFGDGGSTASDIDIEEDPQSIDLKNALTEEYNGNFQSLAVAATIPGQGRGLVANQRIKTGTKIINLPFNAAITPQKAAELSSLRPLLFTEDDDVVLPEWSILALFVAELLTSNTQHNNKNVLNAYAAVLPPFSTTNKQSTIGNVLDSAEVESLEGYLYDLAIEIRSAFEASFNELKPIIERAEREHLIQSGIFTKPVLAHAFSIVLSRLIRIEKDNKSVEVLCCWADFVNHTCDSTAFLQYSLADDAIVLLADRNYSPGEQIFASYGQKTSGELLLSYGFLPEPGTNPHDACLLKMNDKVFPLKMGAIPQGLVEELDSINRKAAMQSLIKLLKEKLSSYSINLEEARRELEIATKGSRREAVLHILVQEQKILARNVFLLSQEVKKL